MYLKDMARAHIDRNIKTQNEYVDSKKKDTVIESYVAGLVSMYNNFASPNLMLDMKDKKLFVTEVSNVRS